MTIEATKMPDDRVEVHYAEVVLYQEFELEGENKILPFNVTILEREKEDDREVVKPERPPKIRRITKPDGKVVYEFRWLKEGGQENAGPIPFSFTRQLEGECIAEESLREAPNCMNVVIKNV